MGERAQPNRWRCLVAGCNPVLQGEESARTHQGDSGHRVARWPQRSADGKRRARERNRTGYYDKYNVGPKSAEARGIVRRRGDVGLMPEDMSIDNAGPLS